MSRIQLAEGLSLPLDIITQTIAILAKRRAGKSYTARRLAEQLLHANQQVVIVDPKGDHWGIRSARDGRSPGFQVVILGGERGDLPLSVGAGEEVARTVAEERVNMLLDLSLFRKSEVATFMTGFLENLYRLKAREVNRTPVMLIVDEADAIAPQKPQSGEERMLGAAEDIVRRGGQRGIGCALITQRSAVLNKNVLTQAQMLVVLRTIAPQDIAAMLAWIDVHGTKEQGRQLIESLPSLPIGQAWFWSPGWPTDSGIFKRATVLPIDTFDSGATPKPGEKRAEPKNLADVDIDALKKQMAATIERAKENDPKELKRQVAELKRELAQLRAKPAPAAKVETKRVEISVVKPADLKRAEKLAERLEAAADRLISASSDVGAVAGALAGAIAGVKRTGNELDVSRDLSRDRKPVTHGEATVNVAHFLGHAGNITKTIPPPARRGSPSDMTLGEPERKILTALAETPEGLPKRKLGIRSGYSPRAGHFGNLLGGLRSKAYVEGTAELLQITPAGRYALGPVDPLPRGEELVQVWMSRLGTPEQRVLRAAIAAYPRALTKQELAEAAGFSAQAGHFGNTLGRLRSLDLIVGQGQLRASEDLFS